jgi:uncharacterized membrane protein
MNWKRRLAKEWLWLICSILGVLLGVHIFGLIVSSAHGYGYFSTMGEFWKELFDLSAEALLFIIIPIVLLYCIRLTVWAIKQVRKKE